VTADTDTPQAGDSTGSAPSGHPGPIPAPTFESIKREEALNPEPPIAKSGTLKNPDNHTPRPGEDIETDSPER
jgi:hypothetical protein